MPVLVSQTRGAMQSASLLQPGSPPVPPPPVVLEEVVGEPAVPPPPVPAPPVAVDVPAVPAFAVVELFGSPPHDVSATATIAATAGSNERTKRKVLVEKCEGGGPERGIAAEDIGLHRAMDTGCAPPRGRCTSLSSPWPRRRPALRRGREGACRRRRPSSEAGDFRRRRGVCHRERGAPSGRGR